MKTVAKTLVSLAAVGAMAVGLVSPATARDRDRGGIDAGDLLAGVAVIGGIAAVAAIASSRNDRRSLSRYDQRYDRNRRDQRYDRRESYQRDAVDLCVRTAENYAARANYGSRAQVTRIRDVNQERGGFEIKGRIAVQDRGRNYQRERWDEGRFTCAVRRGRVVDLDYSGIRGL